MMSRTRVSLDLSTKTKRVPPVQSWRGQLRGSTWTCDKRQTEIERVQRLDFSLDVVNLISVMISIVEDANNSNHSSGEPLPKSTPANRKSKSCPEREVDPSKQPQHWASRTSPQSACWRGRLWKLLSWKRIKDLVQDG